MILLSSSHSAEFKLSFLSSTIIKKVETFCFVLTHSIFATHDSRGFPVLNFLSISHLVVSEVHTFGLSLQD